MKFRIPQFGLVCLFFFVLCRPLLAEPIQTIEADGASFDAYAFTTKKEKKGGQSMFLYIIVRCPNLNVVEHVIM
jgi:hypothetical protein